MKLSTALLPIVLGISLGAVPAAAQSGPQTIVGKVVDGACYMIHPDAAKDASHKNCGMACMTRGVPLAIESEADKKLYFPADGNKQLSGLLNQRVTVTGTVTEKKEPMELKMPVGESNSMSVRVDGGYNVVTIDSIAKAEPAQK